MRKLAFTGHRPQHLGGFYDDSPINKRIRDDLDVLVEMAVEEGFTIFITGMAQGVDTWAAESVLRLQGEGHKIELWTAVPFLGQDRIWPEKAKRRWRNILNQSQRIIVGPSDEVVTIDAFDAEPPTYSYGEICGMMDKRNKWMVDNSDTLLAVWKGTEGGTGNCVKYAKKCGKDIVHYNPDTGDWNPA